MLMSDGRPASVLNQIYIYRLFKMLICDALRYLLPFVQFKKREKHPRRSVNFSKVEQMVPNRATHHILALLSVFTDAARYSVFNPIEHL